MSSFPDDTPTLHDSRAFKQLESAESLDSLLSDLLPSGDLNNSSGTDAVADPVISSKAVGLANAPLHIATGNGSHCRPNPSFQLNARAAHFHSFPQETLPPEEIKLFDEVHRDAATFAAEDEPVVKVAVNKSKLGTPVACQVPHMNPQTLEVRACDPKSNPSSLRGPELEAISTKLTPQPDDSKRKRNVGQLRGGAASDPQKEAQRRYSARHRQKAQEARAQLELDVKQAMDEVEALKLEQEALHSQNTALQNMVDYKDSLISSVRNAFENFATATSTIYSFVGEFQNVILENVFNAPDDQIFVLFKSDDALRSANGAAFNVMTNSVIEWGQASSPADRARIERKLGFLLGVRHRKVNSMWKKDPLRVAKLMHAPPVDPNFLTNFAKAKALYLTNEDLMTAAALTEEQKIALTEHWNEYLDKYNDSRTVMIKSANKLEKSIAYQNCGFDMVGNLAQSTHGFLSAAETVAELERFTSGELIARTKLILGAWDVLRPLQHAILLFDILPVDKVVVIGKLVDGGQSALESSQQFFDT